ncbi:DUF1403 family protein [Rhizobium subbaraonis]|uniref:DUF1403 family protein n=1 Tax=Rhizobium subbaraonis TaxID=908946 RepID=UPI00387E30B7
MGRFEPPRYGSIRHCVFTGIALKSLDDLIRADPPWLGCWRDRLALKSAANVSAR